MRSTEIEVRNPSGLHARPATVFVKAAAGFGSRIRVENLTANRPPRDAKSIFGVLACGVVRGHRIRLVAEGDDEDEAVVTLANLVASGLGEPVEGV